MTQHDLAQDRPSGDRGSEGHVDRQQDPNATNVLFVYGSLIPQAKGTTGRSERQRLRREAIDLGPACIPGRLLDLGAYPGFVAAPRAKSCSRQLVASGCNDNDGCDENDNAIGTAHFVRGQLLRLIRPLETLRWLDAYEGIVAGLKTPEYLRKPLMPIPVRRGPQPVTAWVYVFQGRRIGTPQIASGRWQFGRSARR